MRSLFAAVGAAALVALPEVIALIRDERARRWSEEMERRGREHDAEQQRLDRETALEVARIEALSERE